MSGQCLCSWCVEARQRARDAETADLRDLAAYDQARLVSSAYTLRARVAGVVQKTGTGRWLEATFALPDARFAGQLAGYDFRIRARLA